MSHKSGFVNIIGSPNVGKSTLMNQLVGEKLSIITSKMQTTRHRIMGMLNEEDFQIVSVVVVRRNDYSGRIIAFEDIAFPRQYCVDLSGCTIV